MDGLPSEISFAARYLITAGCRAMTLAEYRQQADGYASAARREETQAILDYFKTRWTANQTKETM